ncbi:DUF3330 domain-containing protein [Klebsiella oxytoca]|uniref:DUF3330 domain-containing protein n=1 Tax=Klebsiella oxytoca TaxID=571 RepID=UPI003D9EF50E
MGSCAAPSAKGDDKFITTDYLQQCRFVNQWRNTTMNANEPSTSCCVCCKEIPLDAAFTPEGAEYVEHFCGLECYQRFQARASTATETSVKPDACDSPPSG